VNNIQNIVPINKALWWEKKPIILCEGNHTGAHSTLKNSGKGKLIFNINSITLKDIIDKFGEIDLLKMDIEGSEFEVLGRSDGNVLRNVKKIVCEVHLKAGDINQLENFLRTNKFDVKKFTPPLIKRSATYSIEVKDLVGLKVFRKLVYGLSALVGAKDETLAILFAIHA